MRRSGRRSACDWRMGDCGRTCWSPYRTATVRPRLRTACNRRIDRLRITIFDISCDATVVNVSLTQELEQIVNKKVSSGMYQTASEVVREGLRLLVERD